jgi:hypothetical protein
VPSLSAGRRRERRAQARRALLAAQRVHDRAIGIDDVGDRRDTKAFTPALAGVNPPSQTATRPAPAPLDLTLGHKDGVLALTGLQIPITAPHLSVFDLDVTSILLGPGGPVAIDLQWTLVNVTIPFPSLLPAGSYTVRLRVRAASTTVEDSGVVVVQ